MSEVKYIIFDVSGLEDGDSNALKDYEVRFSEPVNADWLHWVIKQAIDEVNKTRHDEAFIKGIIDE